jgi:hypothetical protein
MIDKQNGLRLLTLGFAVVIAVGLFLWQGRFGFSLWWDEGHLWYGAQRVLAGDVPILDFRSYDPGRYYWSAAWMALWKNDGILALRLSVALFLIPGLWAGFSLIPRSKTRGCSLYFILSALLLSVWLYPRHKLFDISVCLMLTASLAAVISKPSFFRFFLYGLTTGLASFFGRNHGLYGAAAGVLGAGYLALTSSVHQQWLRRIACWVGGLVIGALPFWFLFVFVPGFWESYWESLLFSGNTILSVPVRWPWLVDFGTVSGWVAIRQIFIGLFFLLLMAGGVIGSTSLLYFGYKKRAVPPALAACVLLLLPYAHHAFSRADISHLAQGIFPLLLCILIGSARLPAKIKWLCLISIFTVSLMVMLPFHPGWQRRNNSAWIERNIGGDILRVPPSVAADVDMLEGLIQTYAPEDRSFIAVPYWPGAYALTRRKAPLYDVYPLFERSEEFQRREIERISQSRPGFALVVDFPLDGMESRRFRNTNPLIEQYIRENFERLNGFPAVYQVYRAR